VETFLEEKPAFVFSELIIIYSVFFGPCDASGAILSSVSASVFFPELFLCPTLAARAPFLGIAILSHATRALVSSAFCSGFPLKLLARLSLFVYGDFENWVFLIAIPLVIRLYES